MLSLVTSAEDLGVGRRRLLRDARASVATDPARLLQRLIDATLADLPAPGSGRTLERWRALCDVAEHDLSLVKLYEGHTDALAILRELGDRVPIPAGSSWGMWAAEPPDARVLIGTDRDGRLRLDGRKAWCSGARQLTHALLTAWRPDGSGPWLARVSLSQPGVRVTDRGWQAVGMAGSGSVDVEFEGASGELVGGPRDYLSRPGFWHGGAGIAACWYGGARALAHPLRQAVAKDSDNPWRRAALGQVDLALKQTAALLRESAAWIDAHPRDDAQAVALRARLGAEGCAQRVLDEVGRALGATPFCRDPRFARMAADLPVYLRQSGADRDFASLGESAARAGGDAWAL